MRTSITVKWILCGLLAAATGIAFAADMGDISAFPNAGHAKELKEEISLLNLLGGLYLSQDQLDKLIPLAAQAAEIKRSSLATFDAAAADYITALQDLRDSLYTKIGSMPAQREHAVSTETRFAKNPRDDAAENLGDLEMQARGILTDAQVAIVEDFKPCLIPPKNLRDPVAVGQASTTEKEEKLMDLIRRMPDDLYTGRRDIIAEAVISFYEVEKGKITPDLRANMLKAFRAKMDEVRAMPPVDYALKRTDLAKSIQVFDDTVTYHQGRTRELGKISQFLLNDNAAKVMKKWRDARAQDVPETPLGVEPSDDIAANREKALREGLRRFGVQTFDLLRERRALGSGDPAELSELQKRLENARGLAAPEEQYKVIAGVLDRLNEMELTTSSLRVMADRIRGLANLKRVPAVAPGAPAGPLRDVTGLGERLRVAREDAESGRIDEAYAELGRVAKDLEAFSE